MSGEFHVSDCIEFKSYKAADGYGRVNRKAGGKWKAFLAHRAAYAEVHGPIPDGMCVCHSCDNRSCINVEHLFLGTSADNMRDMKEKGRAAQGSANGNSKLTEAEIPRIRDMLACGVSQTDIGSWFGVSQSKISDIKHGKRWRHVA